ncbi:protease I [Pseudonocardia hierapolitana]|uniref:Protease I n=2 Tax=Pseudonocardia hierapolitana TaxID=1128676 RepID=A0A561T2S3_9PSEU|nr:protease I [Pseudonocardia hierapolitana]
MRSRTVHGYATGMTGKLDGKRIAILATDGVEQVELTEPRDAVTREGARTEIVSVAEGEIQAMNGDITPAEKFTVDRTAAQAKAADYDALIMPGGTVNADRLRMDEHVRDFVRDAFRAGTPVGVICHGPWTLVEADLVRGRTLTSYPSLRTDIRNAGGNVVDEEVVTDNGLVSSRNPDDLPAFCAKIVEEFAEGAHRVHDQGATV